MNPTALIIPFHNRAEYLKKCLYSLPTNTKVDVILINDASTEPDVIPVAQGYDILNIERNKGIKGVLSFGFDYCFKQGYKTVIALDCDTLVTKDFYTRLLSLAKRFPDDIICGINSHNEDNGKIRNPVLETHKDYLVKRYCNGQCIVVNAETYKSIVSPALARPGNWDYNLSFLCERVIVALPTTVQHIGVVSSMGHHQYGEPDVSLDFPKIKLPDVTLFGIDAHDTLGIIRAAKICVRHIDFGEVRVITDRLFKGREGYSVFCIKEMWKYVKTSHVLIIHPDGYIQNPWGWNPEWLKYDYIGATWNYKDGMNVGNGGFSLRSIRFLMAIKDFDLPKDCIEDDFICREKRKHLEAMGMKFAPAEVADRFSIEAYGASAFTDCCGHSANEYTGQFGFHSYSVKGLPIKPLPKKK